MLKSQFAKLDENSMLLKLVDARNMKAPIS